MFEKMLVKYQTLEEQVKTRLERHRKIKDDHWYWTGSIWSNGYGQIKVLDRMMSVHRAAFIVYNNLKFSSDNIDQVLHKPPCNIRTCFNPDHLYNGTQTDNMQDMASYNINRNKTHCPKGHEYTEANTRLNAGRRVCKECARRTSHEQQVRKMKKKGNNA